MLSDYLVEMAVLIQRMVFCFIRFRAFALTALLAFGLVSTAFGHHFASADDQALASFYQSIGAKDSLCGDDLLSGKAKCNACRLVSAFILAEPIPSPIATTLRYERQVYLPRLERAALMGGYALPQTRAPPRA